MFTWLKNRAQDRRTAMDFYGAIVAQARTPALFAVSGVEDTPEGRTSMIIVLMCAVLERLAAEGRRADRLARNLAETFVTDVDDALREMGVGDLSVPKKVKRAAQALGERGLAYRRALRSADPAQAVAEQLGASVPGLDRSPSAARALAERLLSFQQHLAAAPPGDLGDAIATFSAPRQGGEAHAPQTGRQA